jgi:hypothetical protein
MSKTKDIKVVYYVDTDDNTKGCLCAVPSDKDMRNSVIVSKIAECIKDSGILAQWSNHANDIAKSVAHHGFANIAEYEFGIEEIPLLEC